MKIFYITDARIPTEKAHGYQIWKLCEALARLGHEVAVVVPKRPNHIAEDPFNFYGVPETFRFRRLKSPLSSLAGSNLFAYFVRRFFFLWALFFEKFPAGSVIVTRDPDIALLFNARGFMTVYSAHNWSRKDALLSAFLPKRQRIAANSRGTAEEFLKRGFARTVVAYNAVDLKDFEGDAPKETLRERAGFPKGEKVALYTGHLYEWKGASAALDAAKHLRGREDIMFVFVGGTPPDVAKYKERAEKEGIRNALFLGYRKHSEIPTMLRAADVLLLPNIPSTRESERYTSPLKLFEYMASGTPIVASDLPSIREVLDESNARLITPGDARALAAAVEASVADALSVARAKKAKSDVVRYTWENHARLLFDSSQRDH